MVQRHPSSEAFHALLRDAGEMHDRKQADYGTATDPFANVRSASDWGLPGSLGACIRMGDKLRRLQAFYAKGSLANESVEDAFLDLLVYAGIGLLLYREESAAAAAGAPIHVTDENTVNDGMDTRTCVLCHAFLFNHGTNGECPTLHTDGAHKPHCSDSHCRGCW